MDTQIKEPNQNAQAVQTYNNAEEQLQADADAQKNNAEAQQPAAPSVPPTPPELSADYCILKQIGAGAQGRVYLAKRLADDKQVAIKQLRIDSIKTWKEYTLFHREAEVLEGLDIPGVVKLCETREYLDAQPPCSYIIQEYIPGKTLKEVLKSGYRFAPSRVFDITLQLLDILERLHRHHPPIIHRDIKPSNIILQKLDNDDIKVFLIDFGAVANPRIQNGGSTIAGTYGYMSPEQYVGHPTPQSDIYALGALITYMLSGTDPAEMPVHELRLLIDPYVENHPPALVQTLRRMLEPDVNKRLCDYADLRMRFRRYKLGMFTPNSAATDADLSSKELNAKLRQVKYLCQPGNLEIWQSLPDLPENRPELHIPTKARELTQENIKSRPSAFCASSVSKVFTFIAYLNFIILIFISLSLPSIIDYLNILFIIGITAIISYLIAAISSDGTKKSTSLLKSQVTITCTDLEKVYFNGRKTIATITDIKYLPNTSAVPTFNIYYKFNPPDDDSPYDIVHCIQTHIMPNDKFKVGDPLPILYTLSDGTVDLSMPFPLPLQDLTSPTDYIHSHWRSILESISNSIKTKAEIHTDTPKEYIEPPPVPAEDSIDISRCLETFGKDLKRQDYIYYFEYNKQHAEDETSPSTPYMKALAKMDAQLFQTY